MLKEFKEFAFKGNLIDMAVGIIIGGAFGTVVKSLVGDVVMPLVGLVTGGIDFSDRFTVLKHPAPEDGENAEAAANAVYATADQAKEAGATVMAWGNFVTAFISFIIVAFVIFIIIKKVLGAMKKEEPKKEEAPPEPSNEEKLLTEIRDLLAK